MKQDNQAMLYHRHSSNCSSMEAGFSLLETLIALAIMSLASLSLFQSSSSLLRTSDRAIKVGEGLVNRAVSRHQIATLIAQLVPAWEDGAEVKFVGTKNEFSGMSREIFDLEGAGVKPFEIRLEQDSRDRMKLVYQIGNQNWDIQTGLPVDLKFQYLTPANTWVAEWPPKENRFYSRRDTEDDLLYLFDLKLPHAIQLSDKNNQIIWISKVPDTQNSLERLE